MKKYKTAIIQSNYIPWLGYFDIISKVDLFIFHDDLQYTKNDWRNRNKIKTANGLKWLSIPVGTDEKRLINEVIIHDSKWQIQHWREIEENYKNAKYFNLYKDFFVNFYTKNKWDSLSQLNQHLIIKISKEILGLKTIFLVSTVRSNKKKTEKLLDILAYYKSETYLTGPNANNYIDRNLIKTSGIKLLWIDYSGYPIYKQLQEPFEMHVSIIDPLFNLGPDLVNHFKYSKVIEDEDE